MGIIEKQATRNALFSYLGAGLGFITILFQSHLFSPDENGLLRVLISTSILLAQFSNLGFSTVTIRFFPHFKNKEKGNHGILFYLLLISFIGFSLCVLGFYLFEEKIIASNIEKSKMFVDYMFYILPLTFFTLYFFAFDTYLRATFSSVIGSFTKDLLQRVFILIIIVCYYFNVISFPVFVLSYVIATCVPTFILLYEIIRIGEWHVKPAKGFIDKKLFSQMFNLALFSMFSTFSGAIIMSIDVLMINDKLGLGETGIYSIAFYFGSIILIPSRSIGRITSSLVALAYSKNDMNEIHSLYKKTSNSLLTIGLLLFIGIAINIDNIMQILPAEYASGKYVILIVSGGYLLEVGTGINQLIIVNSKHYYYDTIFILITVFFTIFLNNKLIPIYGITGSAIATAATVTFGNFLRFSFIAWKYKMQPFTINTTKIVLISILTFCIGYFIPVFGNFVLDIAFRSSIVGALFVLLILKLEAAPEINDKIRKNLKMFSIKT